MSCHVNGCGRRHTPLFPPRAVTCQMPDEFLNMIVIVMAHDNAGPARGKVRRLCGMKARGAWSGLDDREIRPNH